MNIHTKTFRVESAVGAVIAAGVLATAGVVGAGTTTPPDTSAADPAAVEPVTVELLTPRSGFTDALTGQFEVTQEGNEPVAFELGDPTRTVVAKITLQPGGQFPWHMHPGPVVVNVTEGQLTYVAAEDCIERPYPAETAFIERAGNVHTAFNSADGATVLVATFFGASPDGPLSITEGVEAPPDCDVAVGGHGIH